MPNMSTNIAVPCCHKQPKNENERHGLVQQQVWYSKPRGRAKDAQGPVEGTGDCARRELGRLSKRRRVGREGRVGRPAPAAQGLSGDPRVVELADRALQRALRSRENARARQAPTARSSRRRDTSLLPTMPGSHFWRSKGTRWWNCPWTHAPTRDCFACTARRCNW